MGYETNQNAVILLSGGMDSAVCLASASARGRKCFCLTFRYGQKHQSELNSASRLANLYDVEEHRIFDVDLAGFGGSSLTGTGHIPKDGNPGTGSVPNTYVPARNLIFLSIAVAWAEVIEAAEIWIGINDVDTSGYPDTGREFISLFENTARAATRAGMEGKSASIIAPLTGMDKAGIVRTGSELGLDFSLTWSCYDPLPGPVPCTKCDACLLRHRGFMNAGITDPLEEESRKQ